MNVQQNYNSSNKTMLKIFKFVRNHVNTSNKVKNVRNNVNQVFMLSIKKIRKFVKITVKTTYYHKSSNIHKLRRLQLNNVLNHVITSMVIIKMKIYVLLHVQIILTMIEQCVLFHVIINITQLHQVKEFVQLVMLV